MADEISVEELLPLLRDPAVAVVDVLPAAAYRAGHIPGTRSVPLPQLALMAGRVLPDRNQRIVIYCAGYTCGLGMQAVSLLRTRGYTSVVHLHGGLEAWQAAGQPVELGAPERTAGPVKRSAGRVGNLLEGLGNQSINELARIWLSVVVVFAALYWMVGALPSQGLIKDGKAIGQSLDSFATALYFSGITATSVGYGDVVPIGIARLLSVAEAVCELLIFGGLVSKLVSRRTDLMMQEMSRNTFEDRLQRVRTNLHLILMELQNQAGVQETVALARLESTANVFMGEVRSIHDLLYVTMAEPEEQVLGSILDSLAAGMGELVGRVDGLPVPTRTPVLQRRLHAIGTLSREICGDCVPRQYADALKSQMDQVQALGSRLLAD